MFHPGLSLLKQDLAPEEKKVGKKRSVKTLSVYSFKDHQGSR